MLTGQSFAKTGNMSNLGHARLTKPRNYNITDCKKCQSFDDSQETLEKRERNNAYPFRGRLFSINRLFISPEATPAIRLHDFASSGEEARRGRGEAKFAAVFASQVARR